jgi:hypothetical protein
MQLTRSVGLVLGAKIAHFHGALDRLLGSMRRIRHGWHAGDAL